MSSIKCKIGQFHVVVVQKNTQEMYEKSVVLVQSCCFAF